ncbi:PLP-dependent cysteine synthase family protein [Pseudomonas aeruginosa]|uniref:PLP-dependent cysteine synthase family protein n=1 Tax=Pseudomonas aeruginosa TaxID=287 RepID=UPI001043A694|nr:pyridoxal-phosphate dependent enzyme [Pseudomonas aeruginosa]
MTVDQRQWAREAIRIIEADFQRSADTHLIPLETPGLPGVELYFKDESSHPTGSLKHRLARSLFLYALCNGWLRPAAPVIEASSGSTAISEAYFARLLGLPFIAVMPASTSKEKIAQIAFYGGQSHLVEDPTQIYAESERLARESGGHFMDQFTYAERATDWRANNNIAESIFQQMRHEPYPTPTWLISSLVAILCDGGERYATTYYDPVWLARQGYALEPLVEALAACVERGVALPDGLLVVGL